MTNWLDGLLPDRSDVVAAWRTRYGVRRQDAFALLWHVGEDVAGAASFVRPETNPGASGMDPIADKEIGQRIRDLSANASSWAMSTSSGQFSLAGAQAKFALAETEDGWAVPRGLNPTTHIFKPAIPSIPDQDLGEHVTMRLARAVGLASAVTELRTFDGARTLIVRRFDRYSGVNNAIERVHQEDTVQALGLAPALRYESWGGPGVRQIARLLRNHVTPEAVEQDTWSLLEALAFNWLVVGTDAHARNYALLHHRGVTRLAPLYDLNSFLPYVDDRGASMAMRIGFTQFDPARVTAKDWDETARDCQVDSDELLWRVSNLAERILPAAASVVVVDDVVAWDSPLPQLILQRLEAHVASCQKRLK